MDKQGIGWYKSLLEANWNWGKSGLEFTGAQLQQDKTEEIFRLDKSYNKYARKDLGRSYEDWIATETDS